MSLRSMRHVATGALAPAAAQATGQEMAPLATAVALLALAAVAVFAALTGVVLRVLPGSWPRQRRWLVAAVVVLAAVALLVLLAFGAGASSDSLSAQGP